MTLSWPYSFPRYFVGISQMKLSPFVCNEDVSPKDVRPLTQIITAKLIKAIPFIRVYRLPPSKAGFQEVSIRQEEDKVCFWFFGGKGWLFAC